MEHKTCTADSLISGTLLIRPTRTGATTFTRHGNRTTVTVRPLHPSAAHVSPITTSLDLGFSPEHEAVRTQLERSLRFGASGDVVLPAEVIRQVNIDGPELIRGTHNDVEVVLRGLGISAAVGTPVTIQFSDSGGTIQATHEGTVIYADRGTDGYALRAKFYDHLTCEFLVPLERGQKGSSDISYTLTKILPRNAVGVIELVRLFHMDEAVCKVFVNGDQLMLFSVDVFLPQLLRDPERPMLAEWTLPGITQPGNETE